jgi:glycosyltransferase involved in cell wall biosynthesis
MVGIDSGETAGALPSGVTLHPLESAAESTGAFTRAGRLPAVVRQAASIGADLYHIHDPELLLVVGALQRKTGAPVVYDKHEYYRGRAGIKSGIIQLIERLFAPGADAVIVVEHEADGAAPDTDDLILATETTVVLPNYPLVEPQMLEPRRGANDDRIRLVYTGVLAAERGLWMMLDAVEQIVASGREVELTLAGVCYRRDERERFESSVELRGLSTRIRRVGWDRYVPWEELYRETTTADLGLMFMDRAYRSWCNIPTKFYEYMSAGLPFVCTDYANWTRFVDSWECGTATDAHDAAGVAAAILDVLDTGGRREDMSASALQSSMQFRWPMVEGRLPALYDSLGVRAH